MKTTKLIVTFLLLASIVKSQGTFPQSIQRRIQFRTIGMDSINLQLNEDYDLIEDSCAQIIRYGHIRMRERKFFGPFKDVSKLNPDVVLSEGNYSNDGLKNGEFTSHFVNGNLRSKGAYKNNKYDGHWEIFYEDGKPALTFDASGDTIYIREAWNADGKKTITAGKGTYLANLGVITWKGKLENGRPEGTWHAFKTDDATQNYIADEVFKKGVFQKGTSPIKDYTDASRIVLVNPELVPFERAEKLHISFTPCNGVKRKHLVTAQYSNGLQSFSQLISKEVGPLISAANVKSYNGDLVLEGYISEKGEINITKISNMAYEALGRNISFKLRALPLLVPASADGKPIQQGFNITFKFLNGMYSFQYRFLPLKTN